MPVSGRTYSTRMSAAFNSKKSFRKGELKIEKDLMCYDQVGDWIQNAN